MIHAPSTALQNRDEKARWKRDDSDARELTASTLEFQLHFAIQPMAHTVLNDGRRA
jgi:hypothetical protein